MTISVVKSSVQSRFFSASSGSEDSSPETSPVKENKVLSTPSPITKLESMIQATTPDRTLFTSEKRKVEQGLGALSGQPLEKKKTLVKRILFGYDKALEKLGPLTIESNMIGIPKMEEIESWLFSFLKELRKAVPDQQFPILVNEDHITSTNVVGTKTAGFHFCPDGHPEAHKIQRLFENPFTNVWIGSWGTKQKISTFFPKSIKTKEQLFWLLSQGNAFLKGQSKAILKIDPVKPPRAEWEELQYPLYVEVYRRENGTVLWSAFPLFYFANFVDSTTFSITPTFAVTSIQLIQVVSKITPDMMQYVTDDLCYVDVAPLIEGCPVPKGVLIGFPKTLF